MAENEQKTEKPSKSAAPAKVKPVKFLHGKTSDYRIIHADGAWGSINSMGNAQIDFFVESAITPDAVVQPVNSDGNFTGEQIPFGRVDSDHILVMHNFQCGVVLSLTAATQVHAILESFINSARKQMDDVVSHIKGTT